MKAFQLAINSSLRQQPAEWKWSLEFHYCSKSANVWSKIERGRVGKARWMRERKLRT